MRVVEINQRIALRATLTFGSIWMFYLFFVYGLLPLVPALRPYQNQLMYWSTWVQLWALPLLMVGNIVIGASAEKRDQETHDSVMRELRLISESHDDLKVLVSQVHVKVQAGEVDVTVTESGGD